MIHIGQRLKQFTLLTCKRPVAVGGLAVVAFTCIAGNRQHGEIGRFQLLLDEGTGDLHLGHHRVTQQDAQPVRRRIVAQLRLGEGDILLVPLLDVGVDLDTVGLEAFGHVADIGFIHIARARAAGDEIIGSGAVESHRLHVLEGKYAIVFEEDQTFGSRLMDEFRVGFQVRFVGIPVALETRRTDNVFQHVTHITVEFGLRDAAILDTGDDAFDLIFHTGFHQVVAGLDGGHGPLLVAPVGHHDALETPFVTQDGGQQIVALLRKLAVELVVRRHYGPGISLADSDFEALEIEFAEGAGVDARVVLLAVHFLVVGSEVLGAHANAIALDAADVGGGRLAGEQRVFGEVLEVTAAERVAVQVLARSQEHVDTILLNFVAHGSGQLLDKRHVPGRSQDGAHGETCAVERRVGAGTGRVDTQAGGTVGHNGNGNTQARDGAGGSGGTGYQRLIGGRQRTGRHRAPATADQQRGFLFKGQCFEDLIDVVLPQLRLGEQSQRAKHGSGNQEDFFHYFNCYG